MASFLVTAAAAAAVTAVLAVEAVLAAAAATAAVIDGTVSPTLKRLPLNCYTHNGQQQEQLAVLSLYVLLSTLFVAVLQLTA
jgi:hypothetical protein